MLPPYRHKIGSTLRLAGGVTLNGQPQDLSGWQVSCVAGNGCARIDLHADWIDATKG